MVTITGAALWAALKEERGIEGRDDVWNHPDLLPTPEDLDDPAGFSARRKLLDASEAEVDEALQKLLSGGVDEQPRDDSPPETDETPDGNDDGSAEGGPDNSGNGDRS